MKYIAFALGIEVRRKDKKNRVEVQEMHSGEVRGMESIEQDYLKRKILLAIQVTF